MVQQNSGVKLWTEWLLLFILLPLFLMIPDLIVIKLILVGLAVIYVIATSYHEGYFRNNWTSWGKKSPRVIWVRFIIFSIIGIVLVYIKWPELLFSPILSNWVLWVFILFVYSLLSVIPQELIYRVFYQKRYDHLFSNQYVAIVINALVFSMAHLFLQNALVLILTFIGGLLFYYNYKKHDSLLLVCAEHAAYGLWIYTLGVGEMLAFPG